MDENDNFKELKQSALSKAFKISPTVKTTTIGPGSTCVKSQNCKTHLQKLEQTPKTKYTTLQHASSKPSPIKKLLAGLEKLRLEDVEQAILERQQQLVDFEKAQQEKRRRAYYLQQQTMVAKVQDQEYQIFQALEEYNKNTEVKNEKLLEYYQEMAMRRRKKNEELQEKERQKKALIYAIDMLKVDQIEFREVFQEIVNLTRTPSSSYIQLNLPQISTRLKVLSGKMEDIVAKCKNGNIDNNDISDSKTNLAELHYFLNEILDKVNLEMSVKKKEDEKDDVITTPPQPKPLEAKTSPEFVKTQDNTETLQEYVSNKSLKYYSEFQKFQSNYEKLYDQLVKDKSFKQFKFDLKKAINIPVNAISGLNAQHFVDKFNRLSLLLQGKSVPVGDKFISASGHPQGIAFCTDLLARKFVLQGDLMISSNPEAAFWYATIIISLWNQFPDFGKLLLAHFHKQCPYLVPVYLPKYVDQSDRDYYENLGYKYNEDGTIEKQDKFLKRMTGIMRLYTAIIVSHPKKEHGRKNPLGLIEGWRWLTAILNLHPRVDVTATLIQVFLETGGFQMQTSYGKQFVKLIKHIQLGFMPLLKNIDSGGPMTRLEVLLQEYNKNRCFERPSGVLHLNFW